jgi:hypothetical protein
MARESAPSEPEGLPRYCPEVDFNFRRTLRLLDELAQLDDLQGGNDPEPGRYHDTHWTETYWPTIAGCLRRLWQSLPENVDSVSESHSIAELLAYLQIQLEGCWPHCFEHSTNTLRIPMDRLQLAEFKTLFTNLQRAERSRRRRPRRRQKAGGLQRKSTSASIFVSALCIHHQYGHDNFTNEPASIRRIEELADKRISDSTALRMFKQIFGGIRQYRELCHNQRIEQRLAQLEYHAPIERSTDPNILGRTAEARVDPDRDL